MQQKSNDSILSKELGVKINRKATVALYPFKEYFLHFENVEAVKAIFGAKTEQVLEKLKISFFDQRAGYMGVSDVDGNLVVSAYNLRNGNFKELYLDVIHELVHVKQFLEGKKIFDTDYEYVDSPVEIEAYAHTVKEARRIGMKDEELVEYLKVEWIDDASHRRLLQRLGVKVD